MNFQKVIQAISPRVLLFVVCVLAYGLTLSHQFKLDDFTYINADFKSKTATLSEVFLKSTNQHYNPLDIVFNQWFFSLWGQNPLPFRLLNIGLFYFLIVVFFEITFRLTKDKDASLIAALLFCLHPINAEIVDQIVFNTVLFGAVFFSLSLLCFDEYFVKRKKVYLWCSFAFAWLAFLTVETTWLLPLVLFVWAVGKHQIGIKQALQLTFVFAVSVLFLFIIWYLLSQGNSFSDGFLKKYAYLGLSFINFFGTLCYLVFWYIQKLFVPLNHIWMYGTPPLPEFAALLCLGTAVIGGGVLSWLFLKNKKLNPETWVAGFWFFCGFIFLVPASLTHTAVGIVVEPYWFFCHSFGFFILGGLFLAWVKKKYLRSVWTVVFIAIISGLFVLTQRINYITQTEKRYSEYWMRISPSPVPLTALAKIAYTEGDYQKALDYYLVYLRKFAFSPYSLYQNDDIYTSIGGLYMKLNDPIAAEKYLRLSLAFNKNNPRTHHFLAMLFVNSNDFKSAEEHFLELIRLERDPMLARVNLADLYLMTKQEQKAIPILKELIKSKIRGNDRRNVFAKLAVLQSIYEGPVESQQTIADLLKSDPDPSAYLILTQAFLSFEKNHEAKAILEQGLKLYPDSQVLRTQQQKP